MNTLASSSTIASSANQSSNHLNTWVDFSQMNEAELKNKQQEAIQNEDYETAAKIRDELKNRPNNTTNITNTQSKKKKDIKDKTLEDIKKYRAELTGKNKEITSQKGEIDRLSKLLQEKEDEQQSLLTDTPSLWDYFSLERRRNANMLKTFEKLKKDVSYPKNLLIYAMGITQSKLFWARQSLKRQRVKLTWNRKAEDIRKNIEILLDRCQAGNESKWKESLKAVLLKEVRTAKDKYFEKLQSQNNF